MFEMRVKDPRSFLRPLFLLLVVALLLVPTIAQAQATIKVSDQISVRFGALLQAWADDAQDGTAKNGYVKNLFLRRMRFLVGGTLTPNISFFFQTDNPNLGKAPKNLGGGFITQDAFVEWKPRGTNAFMIDAGLLLPPLCRDCLGSAGALLSMDYNSWSFLEGPPTQSSVGRDTGVVAKGYLVKGGHLEYRVAAFQGFRQAGSRNGFRATGRVQYNVWDTEVGPYVYPEVYFGNKRILALGVGADHQQNYKAYTADAQLSIPVAKNAFNGIVTLYHFDGGTTFTALPEQRDVAIQAGYYLSGTKVMPFARLEDQNFRATSNNPKDNKRVQVGLAWYPNGNNFNVKAGATRVDPRAGNKTNQFTVQMQFFYY